MWNRTAPRLYMSEARDEGFPDSTCAFGSGGDAGVMHGRSRTSIRPSHPYNAGMEHVGFSRTRQILLVPSAKRREVFDESHEG